jgi:hypothetical protein
MLLISLYGKKFLFQMKVLCNKIKIDKKKARSLIYNEFMKQLNIFCRLQKNHF